MSKTPTSGAPHEFNLDLRGKHLVEERFAEFEFALVDPELEAEFLKYDAPANAAKKRSRLFGPIAVACGVAALLIASAEPLYAEIAHDWRRHITALAALLGLAGAIIGVVGVMRGGAKHKWLLDRYSTERLRQFHFQHLTMRLPEIVAARADAKLQAAYMAGRSRALKNMIAEHLEQREHKLHEMLPYNGKAPEWLAHATNDAGVDRLGEGAETLFQAYRVMRLEHQRDYAHTKLVGEPRFAKVTPRQQERFLSALGFACITFVVGAHVVLGVMAYLSHEAEGPVWLHIGILWAAILGLGGRALEEGLQPQREAERCESYHAAIVASLERFNAANTDRERFDAMRAFERVTADEMRQFLRNHDHAKFLI